MLLVQCCHPPHFFYVLQQLRKIYPDWQFDLLLVDHPESQAALDKLPVEGTCYTFPAHPPPRELGYDRVVFPLFNRGYAGLKRFAWRLPWPAWQSDYQGRLASLRTFSLWRSFLRPAHRPAAAFATFLERSFPTRAKGRVLMVQSYRYLPPPPEWQRLLDTTASVTRIEPGSWWRTWRDLRRKAFDVTIVFYTGERGFLAWKILPFLLPVPRTLIINGQGEYRYSSFSTLRGFWYRRLRYGGPLAPVTLVIQSDGGVEMQKVLETLRRKRPTPHSSVALFCRDDQRSHFGFSPGGDYIFTYQPKQWLQNLRVASQLRKLRASVVVTHLSGRPTYRFHKLLFFLVPAGRRLVVNENLDCFYAGRSALVRFFFWRLLNPATPVRPSGSTPTHRRVLLIQSEDPYAMLSTLDVLLKPHIAPLARVTVYCREDARDVLDAHPAVQRVLTYDPAGLRTKLTSLWEAMRSHPDIVAALFSGRPVFRLHRALFLFLPARSRLLFNQNMDCYFLCRSIWARLFRLRKEETRTRRLARIALIPLIRKLLFLPRFAYLLVWLGLLQLSRNYRLRNRN